MKNFSIFHSLGPAFQNCARRFPVTMAFIILLSAYLCLNTEEVMDSADRLTFLIGYFLSVGTLLSLSLHLWSEEVKSKKVNLAVQATAYVLFLADTVFLYYQGKGLAVGIAHAAWILAIVMSIFFLSFFREKNDIPAWNFTCLSVKKAVLAAIVGLVMSGGLLLLYFSIEHLFGLAINVKINWHILVLCGLMLPSLLFIGMLPQGAQKHDHRPQAATFMANTIRYLFVPLAAGYLLVLYGYAAYILLRWQLPDGWVSWLVTILMAGCIAIETGLYPIRIRDRKPWDERIARQLPALALPLLLLMSIGIARRFCDYGITINRLYLATLNVWFYIVCIGLLVGKARRISWIPISFTLLFLLTSTFPVNYATITRDVLQREVRTMLKGKELPLDYDQYKTLLKELTPEEAERLNDKMIYLDDHFFRESVKEFVTMQEFDTFYGLTDESPNKVLYGKLDSQNIIDIPDGYHHFIRIYTYCPLPGDVLETGKIPVDLEGTDVVYLPLDTLKAIDSREKMPVSFYPCISGKRVFVPIYFYFDLRPDDYGQLGIDIEGYLFFKKN